MNLLASARCVAIAYEWKFAPITVRDFSILLTLAKADGVLNGDSTKLLDTWSKEYTSSYSYRVQLPPAAGLRQNSDVAGLFGLLGPDRMPASEERAAAFERAVSDAIMWELAATRFEKDAAGVHPIVLLQGPLLPKLRGRLFYRYVDPQLPVLVVTSQPEWLVHLVKDVRPKHAVDTAHARALLAWEGPFPPLAIDSGSRAFLGTRSNRVQYHVEVPANAWDTKLGESWWTARRELCEAAFSDRLRVAPPGAQVPPLPAPLAAASLRARQRLKQDCAVEFGFAHFAAFYERMDGYPAKPREKRRTKDIRAPELCYNTIRELVGASPESQGGSAPLRVPVETLKQQLFAGLAEGGKREANLRDLFTKWLEIGNVGD